MKKTLFAALILLLSSGAVKAQDPFDIIHEDIIQRMDAMRAARSFERRMLLMPDETPSQAGYDVIHYGIDIAIDRTVQLVAGRVSILLESLTDSLHSIDIDADAALSIESVSLAGSTGLTWTRENGVVTIELPSALAAGERATLEIGYSGHPSLASYPGLFFRTYGTSPVVYSLSEPWSARTWWPCKDYPDDKAIFDIRISVEQGLTAASNGSLVGVSDTTCWGLPYTCHSWREKYPMPTYLFSVAASNYVRLDDHFIYAPGETMLITNYVLPSKVAQALEDFNIQVPALEFFSSTFGLYPFADEKYGVALCNIGGGMEHQTLTSYGAAMTLGTHQYDYLWVHELSHQWFGDMVTCRDWSHIWLNEGWASYCEALWFEHVGQPGDLRSYMETRDTPSSWSGPILRDPSVSDPWYYFNRVVYHKGAWVLHMLRRVMGDALFFAAARDYLEDPRFRFSFADTDDMREIFEMHYGAPLDWFFDEWLTRTDRPSYSLVWDAFAAGGAEHAAIAVEQIQAVPYTMPVDFRITTLSGTIDTVLWIDEASESFHIAAGSPVLDVEMDPDHWVLRDISETVTGGVPPAPVAWLEQNVPNPFNPSTRIRFGIGEDAHLTISIYDVSGALVTTLADAAYPAGRHEIVWDGRTAAGSPASSGVYFCRLKTGRAAVDRKLVLLR